MKDRYTREIINGFPYPIATMFAKLRTDECLDPGSNRLKYLLGTGEAITRFLGVVNLCQARDFAESSQRIPPQSLRADFKQRFERIAWGTWLHLARESLRWLLAEQAALAMPQMGPFFFDPTPSDSAAVKALGELLTLRNGLSHDKIRVLHAHEFKALCDRAQVHLETALEALAFLLDYELTFISEIDVDKRRRHDPTFRHRLKKLVGNSDDFEGGRNDQTFPLDSHAVVLRHREQSGQSLNLDPLLVYEAAAGKAPDLFCYNGMKSPERAEYVACKHGGNFEGSASERAAALVEELTVLLTVFGDITPAPPALV